MGSSDAYRSVLSSTVIILFSNIIGIGLAFATRIGAAKFLSTTEYGLLILGITVLHIGKRFSSLGLSEGVTRNIPRSDNPADMFTAAISISLIFSVALGLLFFGFADQLGRFIGESDIVPLFQIVGIGLSSSVLFNILASGLRGCEDSFGRAAIQINKQVLIFLGVIIGLSFGFGVERVLQLWIIGLVLTVLLGLFLIEARHGLIARPSQWYAVTREHGPPLVHFSLPLMGSATVWVLLHQTDTLFIGYFLASGNVGVYDAGYTLSRVLILLFSAAQFLFLPILSSLHADRETDAVRRVYYLTTKAVLLLTIPIYVILMSFAPQLLGFVFTPAYTDGALVLRILATGFLVNAILGPTKEALTAVGDTTAVLRNALGGLALNVVLNLILIPVYGPPGAAIASAVGFGAIHFGNWATLYRSDNIRPLTLRIAIVALFSSGLIVGLSQLLMTAIQSVGLLVSVFAVLAYVIHGVVVLLGGVIDSEDVDLFESALSDGSAELDRTISILRRFSS